MSITPESKSRKVKRGHSWAMGMRREHTYFFGPCLLPETVSFFPLFVFVTITIIIVLFYVKRHQMVSPFCSAWHFIYHAHYIWIWATKEWKYRSERRCIPVEKMPRLKEFFISIIRWKWLPTIFHRRLNLWEGLHIKARELSLNSGSRANLTALSA